MKLALSTIDPSDRAGMFLKYAGCAVLNFWNAKEIAPELLRVMAINADLTRRRVNMICVWSDASGDHAELPKGTGRQPKRATRK